MKALLIVLLALSVAGCDQVTANTPQKRVAVKRPVPVHRFVQSTYNPDVAFDTQTGQLCRTWEWSLSGIQPKPDPVTGNIPQTALGQFAPTCSHIYAANPSQISELEEDDK